MRIVGVQEETVNWGDEVSGRCVSFGGNFELIFKAVIFY